MKTTQSELAEVLQKSQSWISRRQAEGMPRDLAGAKSWCESKGIRIGLAAPQARPTPATADAAVHVDARLKEVRRRRIEHKVEVAKSALMTVEAVRACQIIQAGEFHRVYVHHRQRTVETLNKHQLYAAAVAALLMDLGPLWIELQRRADPWGVLRGADKAEVRAALQARGEEVLEIIQELQTSATLSSRAHRG